jgi:hypothetical protein
LNGAVGTTYNGTAQRTLNITPESIGAASVNDAGSRAMPVAIPVSAWEESIDHEDYAYQSEIPIPNIVGDAPGEPGDMITVTFDFASWNIANIAEVAPVVIAINGGAVLLAKEIPTDILYASVTVNKKVVG